jgi:indolepyruvate ferredoxin oxidoreductase alpha subunit
LLKQGDGHVFHGEGILAVTTALLQSGVGYQGSPLDDPEGRQLGRQAVAQGVNPRPQPVVWPGRHRKV